MKVRVPVFLVALFAFTMTAWAQVDVAWDRTGAELPTWFGSNTERGMAYGEVDGEARIYVASYAGGVANVRILNPETGEDVGTLDNAAIVGGFFGLILTDVAVSDDGVIFASNTASIGDSNFKVYRWTSEEADAQVVIDYAGIAGARLGDRISVAGSADDNSLVIYAAVARDNRVVRFTTTDNGDSFEAEVVTLQGITDAGIQPSVHGFADGSFLFNASPVAGEAGINPKHFEADGTLIAEVSGDWLASNTIQAFQMGDRELMATFVGITEVSQVVSFFDITDGLANAQYLMSTPSLGAGANAFAAGDFGVTVDEEGDATVYVMAMNHGLRAFNVGAIQASLEGTFYVGAVGSAPGGADPQFATLGAAFSAINNAAVTGPITLYITSDIDERGTDVVLYQPALTSETALTIRPAAGVDATITLGAITDSGVDATNSGLVIDNTSYVTIDGSYDDEDNGRQLTFVLEDGSGTRVINVVRGASNVWVRNLNIQREVYHASSEGVRVRRAEALGSTPSNVYIENNVIGTVDVPLKDGVGLFGTLGLSVGSTYVTDNVIFAGHRGITTFYNGDDQHYIGNTIHITGDQSNPAWYAGIYLAAVENARISGNEIVLHGANFSTAGRYAAGFVFNVNIGDLFLYNNTISTATDFEVRGSTDDFGVYAFANHRGGVSEERYHIYHNSVRIGETGAAGIHAAVGHPEDTNQAFTTMAKRFNIVNNIFVVEAENGFGLHWRVTDEGALEVDYNNVYVPNGEIGRWRANLFSTLDLWQFSTGLDANSVSTSVDFVSDTDLRLTGGSIGDTDLAGRSIAFVTVDIDGTPRDGEFPYMGAFEGAVWLDIEDAIATLPGGFELHQNYPNPFNPATTIAYTLSQPAEVSVRIYNVAGQLVQELVSGFQTQGRHEVRFNANDLASGVYMYRVAVGSEVQTRQMVLVK
jgi:hypothetical protein